jgi:hypothetical protein
MTTAFNGLPVRIDDTFPIVLRDCFGNRIASFRQASTETWTQINKDRAAYAVIAINNHARLTAENEELRKEVRKMDDLEGEIITDLYGIFHRTQLDGDMADLAVNKEIFALIKKIAEKTAE